MTTTINKYQETFETLSLTNAQKLAFKYFKENGFPTRRNEVYKGTKINHFRNLTPFVSSSLENDIPFFFTHHYMETHLLVFVNGVFSPSFSEYTDEKGLHIFFDIAQEKTEEINDTFVSLAKTFSKKTLTIKVDNNTVVSKPIVIINIAKNQDKNQLINTDVKVILGDNSELEILEDFLNPSNYDFNLNTNASYSVGKNSKLTLNIYQEEDNFYFIGNKTINQDRDSQLYIYNPMLYSNFVRNNFIVNVIGENAHCEINGAFVNRYKMHSDTRIRINHLAPNCTSNQVFRGVLYDESTAVFNGKVFVGKIAQKTNAYQSNKNLILSDDAEIFTKPELEIYADDVKCSHGATTGQLDEDAIFYAMQRGIPKESAKALIVFAFSIEAFRSMKNTDIKNFFEKRFVLKMGLKEYSSAELI